MKTPVCWNAMCFVHVRTDDTTDHYRTEDCVGRLAHQRSTGVWLAELRGSVATAKREKIELAALVGDHEFARRALNESLAALRRRVLADQRWLVAIDEEIGE